MLRLCNAHQRKIWHALVALAWHALVAFSTRLVFTSKHMLPVACKNVLHTI